LERFVDDEYLFKGPGTYIPRVEERLVSKLEALIVLQNNALLIKAKKDTKDSDGTLRKAGEQVKFGKLTIFSGSIESKDISYPRQNRRSPMSDRGMSLTTPLP
jgi:hypothetical protein